MTTAVVAEARRRKIQNQERAAKAAHTGTVVAKRKPKASSAAPTKTRAPRSKAISRKATPSQPLLRDCYEAEVDRAWELGGETEALAVLAAVQ